jgi:large subunit ribosomal protein L3
MTQVFDQNGNAVVCTVIEAEKNVIAQIKSRENDGYQAVQLGFERVTTGDPRTAERRVGKPAMGHFKKAGLEPRRFLKEVRVDDISPYQVGQEISVAIFKDCSYVDLMGVSKGKGYAGVMKKYGFGGFAKSHGAGPVHRHAGSTGQRSTPGRCFPGGKRAGRMGGKVTTVQNLKVVAIDEERQLIVVKGAVPGPNNGLVVVQEAVKR